MQLIFDPDVPKQMLPLRGDRGVAIVGTVADRFGSSAELCDRLLPSSCYNVRLPPFQQVQSDIVDRIHKQFEGKQISSTETVDQLLVAVKIRAGQPAGDSSTEKPKKSDDDTTEKLKILSLMKKVAPDLTSKDTPRTNRFRNQIMQVTGSTLNDGDASNSTVADDALRVIDLTLSNMNTTGDLRDTDELVDSAVKVFGGLSKILADPNDDDGDDDSDGEQETQKSLRDRLALHVDNFCLDLTADSPPGDDATSSSSDDYHFSCQKAMPHSETTDKDNDGSSNTSKLVFMSLKPPASSTGPVFATPPMSVAAKGTELASLQVVHLQSPGSTDTKNNRPCKALPVSELRLLMPKRLTGTTKILIKQRIDITAEHLKCRKYRIRRATGQLRLRSGLFPSSLLHDIKFDSAAGVVQKFYYAVADFKDAVLFSTATTTTASAFADFVPDITDGVEINRPAKAIGKTRRSKVVAASVKLVEQPLPTDYVLSYNSLVDYTGQNNFYRFSMASWLTMIIVGLLILIFSLFMVHAACRASHADMCDQRQEHLQRMYLEGGGIEIYAFPKSVGQRLSYGMGHSAPRKCFFTGTSC